MNARGNWPAALRPKRQGLEERNKHRLNLLREVGTKCE
jgi:hypothetical protein